MILAEHCGTSTSYIGEIEIGKKFPSVEMIQKIADALKVQPYKLFMDESDVYIATLSPKAKEELIAKVQQSVASIIEESVYLP